VGLRPVAGNHPALRRCPSGIGNHPGRSHAAQRGPVTTPGAGAPPLLNQEGSPWSGLGLHPTALTRCPAGMGSPRLLLAARREPVTTPRRYHAAPPESGGEPWVGANAPPAHMRVIGVCQDIYENKGHRLFLPRYV